MHGIPVANRQTHYCFQTMALFPVSSWINYIKPLTFAAGFEDYMHFGKHICLMCIMYSKRKGSNSGYGKNEWPKF